jgi:transcriptional regulator with XRE-family HTH domain
MRIQTSCTYCTTIGRLSNVKRYESNAFGSRLKQAREALSLSQEQLAERLDVARLTVVRWESGKLKPGLERLSQIAEATQRPLAWFFRDSDEDEIIAQSLHQVLESIESRLQSIESALQDCPAAIAELVSKLLNR